MPKWQKVLQLDTNRKIVSGSEDALCTAIRQGADIRGYTEFRHNEHIDTASHDSQIVQENAEFRVNYLLDDRWAAFIMTLRQPVNIPDDFGPRPSMSFFMYNQNGQQAIARPYLDGVPSFAQPGPSDIDDHNNMPKYHQHDAWDSGTNAPSSNFIYDFETYQFFANTEWKEVFANNTAGHPVSGSLEDLVSSFHDGCDVKIAVSNLCAELAETTQTSQNHEVFVQAGSCYYYTEKKLFIAAAHPLVRVQPAIPLRYTSRGWDWGWLMPRTDGFIASIIYDPYTLQYRKNQGNYAIRWFVR